MDGKAKKSNRVSGCRIAEAFVLRIMQSSGNFSLHRRLLREPTSQSKQRLQSQHKSTAQSVGQVKSSLDRYCLLRTLVAISVPPYSSLTFQWLHSGFVDQPCSSSRPTLRPNFVVVQVPALPTKQRRDRHQHLRHHKTEATLPLVLCRRKKSVSMSMQPLFGMMPDSFHFVEQRLRSQTL